MSLGIINRYNLTILVDYSWALYRGAFRFKEFCVINQNGRILTGALFGILQMTELLCQNYPEAQIIFCLDGKPIERQKLFPGYKASRKTTSETPAPEEIQFAKALYNEPFKMLGGIPNVSAVYAEEKEADDLIAKLAILNREAGRDVVIFTSDKDMLQLMQYGANVSKEISDGELVLLGEEYTLSHKDLGVEPKHIPYYRPWKGDASDDIPGAVKAVLSDILREIAIAWYDSGKNELDETLMDQLIAQAGMKCNNIVTGKH